MFKIKNFEFSSSFIHSNLKKILNLDIINSTTAEIKWPGRGRSRAGAGAGAGAAKILIRSRIRSRPKVGRLRNHAFNYTYSLHLGLAWICKRRCHLGALSYEVHHRGE